MKMYKSTHDILLESIDHFAGMTAREIDAYLELLNKKEERIWEKEWARIQSEERAKDEQYMASEEFKKNVLPRSPVSIEWVTAMLPLPVINGLIYVSDKDMANGWRKMKVYYPEEKEKGVVYLNSNGPEIVRTVNRFFNQ